MFYRLSSWMLTGSLLIAGCVGTREYVNSAASIDHYDSIVLVPIQDDPAFQGLGDRVTARIHDRLERSDIRVLQPRDDTLYLAADRLPSAQLADLQTTVEHAPDAHVQAILTGSIDHLESSEVTKTGEFTRTSTITYNVSTASLTLKLIDCYSGDTLWHASRRSSATGREAEFLAADKAARHLVKRLLRHAQD